MITDAVNETVKRSPKGAFVISLDFELYWGVRDKRSLESYRLHLEGVWRAVPQILGMFERYNVRATWATVGFLLCTSRDDLLASAPQLKPSYDDEALSPYGYAGSAESLDSYAHFAPELVKLIGGTPGQEIGTHTLSHYYCLEKGQTLDQFVADVECAIALAQRAGHATESLVFPRNQSHPDYVEAFAKLGGRAYRGNERNWLYRSSGGEDQGYLRRAGRLMDAYLNISGHNTYRIQDCSEGHILNIRSSRFFRPYSRRLAVLESAKLRRLKNSMSRAAKHNEVFHLWWHPHNFGVDLVENLSQLESVLEHYIFLRDKYGMRSFSMSGVANELVAR